MSGPSGNGGKRRLATFEENKENEGEGPYTRQRTLKSRKTQLTPLERMHKDFLKEFGAPQKSSVKPNLNTTRKNITETPPLTTPGCSGISKLQEPPPEGWELPKKTSRPISAQLNSLTKDNETNRFQPLSGENDMDLDTEEKDTSRPDPSRSKKFQKPPPINPLHSRGDSRSPHDLMPQLER